MKRHVILISAVSGDIGSSAARSLSETGNIIIGCDLKGYSTVSDLLEKHYQAPAASQTDSYIAFLREIIEREGVGFFLPISEPEIEVLNHCREEMDSLGVKLLLNNRTILDNVLDKLTTAQYLQSIGVRAPGTVPLSAYDGSFGYPLIVKDRKGCGSKKIWIIEDSLDLEYVKNKNGGSLIAQEYINKDNDEDYTTGVFSDGKVVSSITFRRKLGYGGLSIEAVLVDEPYLDDLSRHIGEKMQLFGSINIQSRRAGDIFIPYEINPRLSSTLLFRKRFGFDDAAWWLDALLGKGYLYKRKYKSGRAIRCLSECYFEMDAI